MLLETSLAKGIHHPRVNSVSSFSERIKGRRTVGPTIRLLAATLNVGMCWSFISSPAFPSVVHDIVYKAEDTERYSQQFVSLGWLGNEIQLGPGPRVLRQIDIGYTMQLGAVGTIDVAAKIYASNAPSGFPQTLLWDSGVSLRQQINDQGFISYEIPNVVVPDVITVITRIVDFQASNGYQPSMAVTMKQPETGTRLRTFTTADGLNWGIPEVDYNYNMAMRVYAVSEPVAAYNAILALLLSLVPRTRGPQCCRTGS